MKRLAALVLAAGSALGCSGLCPDRPIDPAGLSPEAGWTSVPDVPFVPQRTPDECGPAALAMLLARWKAPGTLEEVARACPAAPGRGVRAGDLREIARRKGLKAFLFEGRPEDLSGELSRGRPLIVGLVRGGAVAASTHYEVVVALHALDGRVVTWDPAGGPRCSPREEFLRDWTAARRLILLVFRDAPPRAPSEQDALPSHRPDSAPSPEMSAVPPRSPRRTSWHGACTPLP